VSARRRTTKLRSTPNRPEFDPFVALADPTRRRLLEMLRDGERSVQDLADGFDVTRSAISQHLRVLRDTELVEEQRMGRHRLYRIRAAALREVFAWIKQYEAFWDERIDRLRSALDEEEGDREKH
jgi:DNA-binding transcriptional ArsR family regulator